MSGAYKANAITTMERAFDLIQRLQSGQRLTSHTISELYGCSYRNACRIMNVVQTTLPVSVVGSQWDGGEIVKWMR